MFQSKMTKDSIYSNWDLQISSDDCKEGSGQFIIDQSLGRNVRFVLDKNVATTIITFYFPNGTHIEEYTNERTYVKTFPYLEVEIDFTYSIHKYLCRYV